ncbi:uncharacterized protein LOC106090931 [Stomoxys calcitrans]|uniref:uncharacterized protein LOC106090931 n=1 Tax=Stomoxys calcitrans TaxID=35570 RepID=UPI0027E2C4FC|nr:uncharacterized protein LOC106090931 [Stomoxys calcitrans]
MEVEPPKLEMLRSVKGKDMLLVNGFLYHYDDRNSKAYRWVCSRRKDKPPCRVRLYTTLIDEWDLTRHKLENVVGDHPHGPADEDAIIRGRDKKRQADAEGLPCTLGNKSLKRKYKQKERKGDSSSGAKQPKTTDDEDDDNSSMDLDNSWEPLTSVVKTTSKQIADKKVLMLKTTKGYHMIAVEGCVYRLDGKSMISCTYRWKCFRSKDLQCTGRIYTECLASGLHRYKPFRVEENKHNHQPYTEAKIDALIRRNNIKILQGKEEQSASKVFKTLGENDSSPDKKPKTPSVPLSVSQGGGSVLSISTNINLPTKPSVRKERAKATAALYRYVADPMDALNEPRDGEITKFSFLPSLKGNRILILDNMIFHYDSRGTLNERAYWTCLYRRDKKVKCNCRLTTEFTGENMQIVKVSGGHTHNSDHRQHIDKRLKLNIAIKDEKDKPQKIEEISFDNDNNFYDSEDNTARDDDDYYGENVDLKQEETAAEISEFLQLKKEKIESHDISETAIYDNDPSNLIEYAEEIDPFHGTIEYVEMERVNSSKYHSDSDNSEHNSSSATPKIATRSRRGRKRKFDYDQDEEEEEEDEEYAPTKGRKGSQAYIRKMSKNMPNVSSNPDNIDITKTSKLRSAKGGELLCVDGYIYHLKSISPTTRTYWACIKSKDRILKCPARVTTITTEDNKLKVVHLSNSHTHAISEDDIKKRLFNEFAKTAASSSALKSKDIMDKSLSELNPEFAEMLMGKSGDIGSYDKCKLNMKLYAVSDGPPSLAVRMCLKALNLPYELHSVDYIASEHLSDEYAKMNPQKEIPVLDDDGFFLSESIAIMQYLCDKYGADSPLYPNEPKERALVNHRLCFNMKGHNSNILYGQVAKTTEALRPALFGQAKMICGLFIQTYVTQTSSLLTRQEQQLNPMSPSSVKTTASLYNTLLQQQQQEGPLYDMSMAANLIQNMKEQQTLTTTKTTTTTTTTTPTNTIT